MLSDQTVCKFMLCTGSKVFLTQKFELSRMYRTHAQSGSYCTAFCSPYIPFRKKTRNTQNMQFSVNFPYLCAKLVQPRFACPSANCTQFCALCTRNYVSMTPVQLVQNVHRFTLCAIGQVMLHSSAL